MEDTITITRKSYWEVMSVMLIALNRVAQYAESDAEEKESDKLHDRAVKALDAVFDQVGIKDGGL